MSHHRGRLQQLSTNINRWTRDIADKERRIEDAELEAINCLILDGEFDCLSVNWERVHSLLKEKQS